MSSIRAASRAAIGDALGGAYAERRERPPSAMDRWARRAVGPLARRLYALRVWPAAFPRAVTDAETGLGDLTERQLVEAAVALREPLRRVGFQDALVARAFALVREAARRTLGQRHYDVQLIGGRVMLGGLVAEMETGEGKTLTATLAAATAALAGIPVHVVTVNDYLAARDAEWMGPIYRALGLTVGVVVHGLDHEARCAAYECDITYCSNKELAFDYLRDRMVLGQRASRLQLLLDRLADDRPRAERLTLRGLHFAIVDEADSVLVDEARTPLIISGPGDTAAERRMYERALELAAQLLPATDFTVEARERRIELTERGRLRLDALARPLGGPWRGRLRRENLVRGALRAQHLVERDVDYVLSDDGRVVIVDEFTGRRMPDRAWEQDLHQLLEVKEGVALTRRNETLARISYQRFFRRYLRLAGMTGTALEVAPELWSVYGLGVWRVPPNRAVRRRVQPAIVCSTAASRWAAVIARVTELQRAGRPILLGTRSVAASEHLSRLLHAAGLAHRVLNARQDAAEAEIVAAAGEGHRITVSTNMAGRGTDIKLAAGVAERGGLHVIATEYHEARRIDRQLFGRCGRQGDPGTCEVIASLEDDLMLRHGGWWRTLGRWAARRDGRAPGWIARWLFGRAQRRAERLHARMRADLVWLDEHLDTALAFSGRQE